MWMVGCGWSHVDGWLWMVTCGWLVVDDNMWMVGCLNDWLNRRPVG